MLVVATMDPPSQFSNNPVTYERIKILKRLKPLPNSVVFGQYQGYKHESNINPKSSTDTFFALKTEIVNSRWQGVPIYMRAGKKLAKTLVEISIVFKTPKNRLFGHDELGNKPNILTYRIQPDEKIILEMLTKRPGHKIKLNSDSMQFSANDSKYETAEAYEKLLYDTISGDPTFFNDSPEVEAAWKFIDKLRSKNNLSPIIYKPGTWGPKEANLLIEKDGRHWLEPSNSS